MGLEFVPFFAGKLDLTTKFGYWYWDLGKNLRRKLGF